jgi:hypothetical protein
MNPGMPGADDLTLADVQREFAAWEFWQGPSGTYYGRRPGRPRRHRADMQARHPRSLRDQILTLKADQ